MHVAPPLLRRNPWRLTGAWDNLYVVDTENHAIRKIDARTGTITTVAGGRKGAGADGLDRPHGCVLDGQGNLYIADSENHRVQRVR